MDRFNPYLSWPPPTAQGDLPINDKRDQSPSQGSSGVGEPIKQPRITPAKKGKPPTPGVSDLVFHDSTDVTHTSIATEPVNPATQSVAIIEHLDLNTFKITQCSNPAPHNHKQCPNYHNGKDRKRSGNFYSADMCEYADKDDGVSCPRGEACPKSHNRVEQLYRPEKYKSKFCSHFPNNPRNCEYGPYCSFAHSEQDINIELIHNYEYDDDFYMFYFKTIHCPFNLTQHDKAQCVYAHNWQDYRRKPNAHSYEPISCPHWKSTDYIMNYADGCPNGVECTKCHGWKELEYHPLNYRTKQCNTKTCQKGRDCPFFHATREKRVVTATVTNKCFKYFPRNRIISNTFKRRSEAPPSVPNYRHNDLQFMPAPPGHHKSSMDSALPPTHTHSSRFDQSSIPFGATINLLTSEVFTQKPSDKRKWSDDVNLSATKEPIPFGGKKNQFTEKYRKNKLRTDDIFQPTYTSGVNDPEIVNKLTGPGIPAKVFPLNPPGLDKNESVADKKPGENSESEQVEQNAMFITKLMNE